MIITSLNIGKKRDVVWKNKQYSTGIFKFSVNHPITLDTNDVVGDHVIDRKYHGGVDKACYIYSADAYKFWQPKYPELKFEYGMFGENLTVTNFDESKVFIGNRYQIGEAIIEISQPRQPCIKLGIRFGNQKIVKEFLNNPYPGSYVRVIKSGEVKVNDTFNIIFEPDEKLSLKDSHLLMVKCDNIKVVQRAVKNPFLAASYIRDLKKKYKI